MARLKRPVPPEIEEGLAFGVPYSGVPGLAGQLHQGKDWLAPKGTPCWFRESGTVIFVGPLGELGNYVQLVTDDGLRFWGLAHLSWIWVGVGAYLTAGQWVGRTGGVPGESGAGRSTGPHLHEEVREGDQWGLRMDPDSVVLEEDMQSIVDSLNLIWARLSEIQQEPFVSERVKNIAESAKQEGIVAIKKAIGLQ